MKNQPSRANNQTGEGRDENPSNNQRNALPLPLKAQLLPAKTKQLGV
ncbi:hypothetical protein EV13_2521 [Prochlorococcus sp. MIT 0702]|nr:hypothetical protein EV12_2308 [Prochlorococcus sp. MIT 0701]KGG26387.1 hypothetical protein EV13_2521 [Prochlorococcus sp. MIT 0702]KGG31193.1 hypothetical protein EV14_2564 [Prochlorococcus sp. MIT 0703]